MIGLPSLGDLDRALPGTVPGAGVRIWLCTQRTDMRCGFDRLAALAQEVSGQDPTSGHLFVSRGRGGDRLKVLYWDRDGYALWYKRLEEGQFKLPRFDPAQRCVALKASELAMLLEGIDLGSVKRVKRYQPRPRSVAPAAGQV